jgi:hypothetical protein
MLQTFILIEEFEKKRANTFQAPLYPKQESALDRAESLAETTLKDM